MARNRTRRANASTKIASYPHISNIFRSKKPPSAKSSNPPATAPSSPANGTLGWEPYFPDKQGFDVTFGAGFQGSPGNDDGYFAPYHVPNLPDAKPGEHLDIRLATEGAKWLAQQKKSDKPLALLDEFL